MLSVDTNIGSYNLSHIEYCDCQNRPFCLLILLLLLLLLLLVPSVYSSNHDVYQHKNYTILKHSLVRMILSTLEVVLGWFKMMQILR